MKPMKITSSFSKREKMRRNPFSLRKSRSISFAFAVHSFVELPGFKTIMSGWDNGDIAKIQHQLQRRVVLVGSIHKQVQRCRQRANAR